MDDGDALHKAAEVGDLELVTNLLALGANVNGTSEHGNTALHLAASRGHMFVVAELLAQGAAVTLNNSYGDTALHSAAENNQPPIVETLLNRGADMNGANCNGESALHIAVRGGHKHVVEMLLTRGADVNRADRQGDSALHCAALGGHLTIAEELIARGAKVNCTNGEGILPLHRAALQSNFSMVTALLAHGADVHATDRFGNTAFHAAASMDNEYEALELWRGGADPLKQNNKGETPLSLLLQGTEGAEQLRTFCCSYHNTSDSASKIRRVLTFLASRSFADEEMVSAQDAVRELRHVLQVILRHAGAGKSVKEREVEEAVMLHMDRSTGLLGIDAVIKTFYRLRRKYLALANPQVALELRSAFRNATQTGSWLRTNIAKQLLRTLFYKFASRADSSQAPVPFTGRIKEWKESEVDALLAKHSLIPDGIFEEGFMAVGMKVLFANK